MIPTTFAAVADHLWQSTLLTAVVGLLTLALRRNRGRARYWLWLVASYKFLFPFSWLVSIGHQFAWRTAAPVMPPAVSAFTGAVGSPLFLKSLPAANPATGHPSELALVIVGFWACGFVVVAAGWIREWMRINAITRAASPLPLALPIPVVSISARLEPGIFGIFRPVLLLPEGIESRMTQAQLQAIFAHELCHARRRDNLAALIHMLVEALFWFYPLVWWLEKRMIDERECACDEDVLELGGEPQVYAESILKVCEFYAESPLTSLSGVTGSDLKKRMQRIMGSNFGEVLSTSKKLLLATAGIATLALPIVAGILTVRVHALNQIFGATAQEMTFEVASVKPNKSGGRPTSNIPLSVDDMYAPTGGLFSATNYRLFEYLRFAYKSSLSTPGLPAWGTTDRFDIEARAQGNPTKDQYRLMMQSLLADRFKLAVHTEIRQSPVYAIVLAKQGKMGPQLRRDDGPCDATSADAQAANGADTAPRLPRPSSSQGSASQMPQIPCGTLMPVPASAPGRFRIAGRKVPIALLAMMATNPISGVDRPVFDHTGLTGTFDMSFEWTPEPNGPPPAGFQPDSTGPTFFEALQDELGLKLEPQIGPVEVLVIDHVEEPTAN